MTKAERELNAKAVRKRLIEIALSATESLSIVEFQEHIPDCNYEVVRYNLSQLEAKGYMQGNKQGRYLTYRYNAAELLKGLIHQVWRCKKPLFSEPRSHMTVLGR